MATPREPSGASGRRTGRAPAKAAGKAATKVPAAAAGKAPARGTRKASAKGAGQATLEGLVGGRVLDVALEDRMEQAFLDYSMSVIVGRALPDVRDGLKPVQRRILYSMWESGLRPDRPSRKCASAVGEVMKTYHPHGDTSIYDALVRMAQDFATRDPLIDGHGNFGSIDGDPAAAMRYTEARLSALAMVLLDGIDEDTVDHVPNYDGYATEPTVLPSRFPNLLVNGASGIAVGMATNIPPHNLGELIDACLLLVKRPGATVDELMKHVPAPDFPTGARIVAGPGIRDAYVSGRGAITVEAIATTETRSGNLPRIVVTEIPYQVNKGAMLERMADLVAKRTLEEVRDLRDESSRDGMRVVIELKRGADPATVLRKLYRHTDLRTNFNVNLVALVDGAPRTLGLREALVAYLDHQRDVLTRRTRHRLERARARAHVLEGLLRAIDELDAVIALIRGSKSAAVAKQGLMERFDLSEVQAQAVLDLQLRRLAALERSELEDEYQGLVALIAELERVLGDAKVLDALLVDELKDIRRVHATPRRSRLEDAVPSGGDDEEEAVAPFEAQEVTVTVTRGGLVRSLARRRTTPVHPTPSDPLAAVVRTTTAATLLLVDAAGTGHRIAVADVAVTRPGQRGTSIAGLLGGAPDAPIVGAVVLDAEAAEAALVTASASGQVKRTLLSEFLGMRQRSVQASGVRDGDELVAAIVAWEDDDLVLAHDGGMVTRFPASEARIMGRSAAGVAGMQVPAGARLVALSVVPSGSDEGELLTIGADGTAWRVALAELATKGRGGKGIAAGRGAILWSGTAADLHLSGPSPRVLAPTEVPIAKRGAKGSALEGEVAGPVVAEVVDDIGEA